MPTEPVTQPQLNVTIMLLLATLLLLLGLVVRWAFGKALSILEKAVTKEDLTAISAQLTEFKDDMAERTAEIRRLENRATSLEKEIQRLPLLEAKLGLLLAQSQQTNFMVAHMWQKQTGLQPPNPFGNHGGGSGGTGGNDGGAGPGGS